MPQELHDHTVHMEVANELLRVTLALLRVRERDGSLQQSLTKVDGKKADNDNPSGRDEAVRRRS